MLCKNLEKDGRCKNGGYCCFNPHQISSCPENKPEPKKRGGRKR